MRDIISDLLGEYVPQSDNGVILEGIASIDWVWITGAILFICAFIGFIACMRTLLRSLVN